MFEFKCRIFFLCCDWVPCGHIGNVEVYKAVNGYYLVDECDNSKFKFIK